MNKEHVIEGNGLGSANIWTKIHATMASAQGMAWTTFKSLSYSFINNIMWMMFSSVSLALAGTVIYLFLKLFGIEIAFITTSNSPAVDFYDGP